MYLEINDKKTIRDLQSEFSLHFPFLRIEFFSHPHFAGEPSPHSERLSSSLFIGAIRKLNNPGLLEVHSWQNVSILEKAFEEQFGLFVQVCRLHNEEWVQTVGTDNLSLKEQNELGRNATLGPDLVYKDPKD